MAKKALKPEELLATEDQDCATCGMTRTRHLCRKCRKPICYRCDTTSSGSKLKSRKCPSCTPKNRR